MESKRFFQWLIWSCFEYSPTKDILEGFLNPTNLSTPPSGIFQIQQHDVACFIQLYFFLGRKKPAKKNHHSQEDKSKAPADGVVLKVPSVFASKIPEGEERLKLIEEIKVPGIHQWDIIPGIQWTKVHYLTKNHPADLGPNKNTHVYTFGFS